MNPTNPMTDQELKLELCRMFPEQIRIVESPKVWDTKLLGTEPPWRDFAAWKGNPIGKAEVLDTEMLHVCHLIELGMNSTEHREFRDNLCLITMGDGGPISATWQQRGHAILKVKGLDSK